MTGPRVVGLDARNGTLLWSHPFQMQYDESIGTPVVAGNMVVVTGDGHPARRYGSAATATVQGQRCLGKRRFVELSLVALAVGDIVYGMNDGGEFVLRRFATGKTLWAGGKQGYYCTPVLAGQRLLCLNDRG